MVNPNYFLSFFDVDDLFRSFFLIDWSSFSRFSSLEACVDWSEMYLYFSKNSSSYFLAKLYLLMVLEVFEECDIVCASRSLATLLASFLSSRVQIPYFGVIDSSISFIFLAVNPSRSVCRTLSSNSALATFFSFCLI